MQVQKILISKEGYLSLYKMGKMYMQFCPYNKERCGLQCPLFSPPVHQVSIVNSPYKWELEICKGTIEAIECIVGGKEDS